MLKTLFRYCVVFVMLNTAAIPVSAQDTTAGSPVAEYYNEDSTAISDEQTLMPDWSSLVQDSAFRYKNEREAVIQEVEQDNSWLEKALTNFFKFFASGAGTVLFWLLVSGTLVYILYRIFKGDVNRLFNRREKKILQEETPGQLSKEDLLTADWQAAMQAALSAEDFRSATRFAFVHILQLLHKNEYISYRIDTTNSEYIRSVKNDDIRQTLKPLLLRYEYAWFGRMPVDRLQWEQTFAIYSQLKSKLQ